MQHREVPPDLSERRGTGIISSVMATRDDGGRALARQGLAISLETATNTADSSTATAPRPISAKPGLSGPARPLFGVAITGLASQRGASVFSRS